jgi:RNA polymerase sigma-70 factor (ECF subfamily)
MIAAVAGDEGAYRRLLTEIAPRLRSFARNGLARAGRSTADAEDVVQETLLALHIKRHTWNPTEPLGPWVRGIARHKLIDVLRRRGASGAVAIDELADSLAAPEQRSSLPARDVLRHTDALAPGQRAVVRAIFVDGSSTAEAALALGLSEGAVRVQLHRGIKALAALVRAKD